MLQLHVGLSLLLVVPSSYQKGCPFFLYISEAGGSELAHLLPKTWMFGSRGKRILPHIKHCFLKIKDVCVWYGDVMCMTKHSFYDMYIP